MMSDDRAVAPPEGRLQFVQPEHLMLLYATGGAGKSTFLAQLAAHVWKTHQLKTRIVGADGGGTKAFQVLIRRGIVDYWPIDMWDADIWTAINLATKGWWPEDTGIPNSKLLPPYEAHRLCPFCSAHLQGPAACAACHKAIPPGTAIKQDLEPQNGFEAVGAYGFESLYALGDIAMRRLKVSDKGALEIKDEMGGEILRQSALHHYGIVQDKMHEWVGNTRRMPVHTVVWTTLELRGNDDGYGKPIYGPVLVGKKLTALCSPWFTDVIHLELEPGERDAKGLQEVKRVLYLADHFPADTKPYGFVAKTSVPGIPTRIPAEGNAAARYFEEVERAYQKQEEVLGLEKEGEVR